MLTFNVGPSKISEEVKKDILEACENGILETSHRTKEFSEISKTAVLELKKFFKIPKEYKIFYTSSATEAMELSVANACQKKAYHFVNGFFSDLFCNVSKRYNKKVIKNLAKYPEQNNFKEAKISKDVDFIALAHCDTATGLMCSMEDIKKIRNKNKKAILAVDITSTAGATEIDIKLADIWFFSIQKCLGLPSGMGIIVVSKRAYQKSLDLEKERLNLSGHFTFSKMHEEMDRNFQTACTPNILGIYLLGRQLRRWNKDGGAKKKINDTKRKYEYLNTYLNTHLNRYLRFFVKEEQDRSLTVFYLKGDEKIINNIRKACAKKGIVLGEGYSQAQKYAIRIALFPAITFSDLKKLKEAFNGVLR